MADAAVRESWIRDKDLKAFTMTRGGAEDVDVLLVTPVDHATLLESSSTFVTPGLSIKVARIDALIEMKLDAGRDQDRADVDALRRLKEIADE